MNIIHSVQLKKPTMFQMFIGALILFLKKRKKQSVAPKKIGKYILVSEITKAEFPKFALGIYSNAGEKVFIKTWSGKIKDMNYYSLVNESRASILLNKKLEQLGNVASVRVAKVKDIIQCKNTLSVVFEYVDGTPLDRFGVSRQIDILEKICNVLVKISETLTVEEREYFTKRTFAFYIFAMPALIVFVGLIHPTKFFLILRTACKSISSLKVFQGKELVLAHRDLAPHNILLKESIIYLLDCETVTLTLPFYDPIFFSVDPDYKRFNDIGSRHFAFAENAFLKLYMILFGLVIAKNLPAHQEHYLSIFNGLGNAHN